MNGTAWLFWLGAAIALAVVEAVTVDFVFIMLALGALAGALVSFFGAEFPIAVFVAIAVAILGLWLVRPVLRKSLKKTERDNRDIGVHAIVGSYARVLEETDGTTGLVKVAGDSWSATSAAGEVLEAGQTARVLEVRGARLIVEPVSPHHYPQH